MGSGQIGRTLLAIALAAVLGCAAQFRVGRQTTTLTVGMTKETVEGLLGTPNYTMVQELNGVLVETWKYLDRTVTFYDGIVYSWGAQSGPPATVTP